MTIYYYLHYLNYLHYNLLILIIKLTYKHFKKLLIDIILIVQFNS